MQAYTALKPNLQILRNQIGGSFEFDDELEPQTRPIDTPQSFERAPERKDFPSEGRLIFAAKSTEAAGTVTIKSLKAVAHFMPKAGHEIVETADAISDLLRIIVGLEEKKPSQLEAKTPEQEAKKQEGLWVLSKTKKIAQTLIEVARERIQALNIKSLREQVNTALGLSKTNEQTVNATGNLRVDVQVNFDKALAEAEKKKKASAFSIVTAKLGKKSYGPNLNLNQASEKTAGGMTLTSVG